jgi:hypothetical protein
LPASRGRIPRARSSKSETWPADQVERWPLSKLIPYARNARTHSDEQVAQIAASIREWGWTVPVLVDEQGTLIAGHGRVLAAQQLGITDVPTMVARGWTQAQIQAYRLTDNQLALNAGWDRELLGLELGELKLGGFDLALTGFGELELGDLLGARADDGEPAGMRRLAIPTISGGVAWSMRPVASGRAWKRRAGRRSGRTMDQPTATLVTVCGASAGPTSTPTRGGGDARRAGNSASHPRIEADASPDA